MTETSELVQDAEWQRLDRRMLLVYPLRDLIRFLPVLIGLVIAGSASGGVDVRWQLLGIGIPVTMGLLRYATTSFRITEGRVELKRGLVDRHLLSTRIERVRTVELTASPFHRVLGLTTVRIGTGTASTNDDDAIDLDGLPAPRARALREALLRASGPVAAPDQPEAAEPAPPPPVRVVLRLDPRWARFAPLTSAGVVLAAGVIGVGSQILDGLGAWDQLNVDVAVDEPSREWLFVRAAAGGRGGRPGLGAGGRRLPDDQLGLHPQPRRPPTTPGTCAAGSRRPARRASTTSGSAGCRSASRWACG